jgi:ABC-2 type transport system ATP-binding protein
VAVGAVGFVGEDGRGAGNVTSRVGVTFRMAGPSSTPMTDTTPTIEAHRLTKTYPGGVEAVKGIDFAVGVGEVFGLLGPNGAGKSTTVGVFATTVAPTSGTARLAGHDVATQPLAARRVSAVVFQDAVVDKPLSGRQNLMVHARLWGLDGPSARARVSALVDLFDLGAIVDRPVGGYSGGERRRLEIARALISEPRVLFLDEPTVGLDPRVRHELLDLIAGLRARSGMTILLTTHYLDEAEELCDRVAIVHAGRIVALDTPAALLAGLGREIVELRVAGDPATGLALLRSHNIAGDDAYIVGNSLHVPLHGAPPADVTAAVAGLGMATTAVITRPPTLDDVYLQLTGQALAPLAA